jgi:hypothetical protein
MCHVTSQPCMLIRLLCMPSEAIAAELQGVRTRMKDTLYKRTKATSAHVDDNTKYF